MPGDLAAAAGRLLRRLASDEVAQIPKGPAARDPRAAGIPIFPRVLWTARQNALMLVGAAMVAAVLWQRAFGTVMIPPAAAAILVAFFAAAVTVVVDIRTKRALLREP